MGVTGFATVFVSLLSLSFLLSPGLSGPVSIQSISPNFTASHFDYIDNYGTFLSSQNGSFQARITNSRPELRSYYLAVIHVATNTIIWSANRNKPMSDSSQLRLTQSGLGIYNDSGQELWSTSRSMKKDSVAITSLQLMETGNLVMVDSKNSTVWQSFDFPNDVLVMGQNLRVGQSLVCSKTDDDLSEGSYTFVLTDNDVVLQWNGVTYWKLSMDTKAYRDTNYPVEYAMVNSTGMYLMGSNGSTIVMQVVLQSSSLDSNDLRVLKIGPDGVFGVFKVNGDGRVPEFTGPADRCRIPYVCRSLGVCTNGGGTCQCAPGLHVDQKGNDCVPTDKSLALPGPCNGPLSSSSQKTKYLMLRDNLDYFSNEFIDPMMRGVNLSACQSFCTRNCSCLGVFYSESSGSCYVVRDYLGSIMVKSSVTRDRDRLGYIKAIVVANSDDGGSGSKKSDFPVWATVLLPSAGVVVIMVIAAIVWSRRRKRRNIWANSMKKSGNYYSSEDSDTDFVSIPGLPVRFEYEDLVMATEQFKNQIGSGGFGTVYKGTLRDGNDVAVKKITCLGAQGKREFLTEIAVIGKIHHVNLVRLKGFCAHRGQRFLVYEYMNRGSLDHSLFGDGPVIEWNERYEIALGTARGLAYLHTGCEHKIIHCDVKPENILLHDKSQVKISDFGLSKLLSPEESGLFTTLRGTRGYLAPEWLTSSAISDKTDVYSYGMVLLELLRGKKNSSPQTRSDTTSGTDTTEFSPSSGDLTHRLVYFPLFALEMHEEGRYIELVDPRLMGRVDSKEVEAMVKVALCCVQEDPSLRPSMSNVVGMLEGGQPLGNPRPESLNFLRFYGRRFTEASRLEECNEDAARLLHGPPNGNAATATTTLYNSFSYVSSQQVSGPR